MADFFSILEQQLQDGANPVAVATKYVPVDPANYTGTWKGTYSTGEKFSFSISDVQGFRAKVKYQSGNGPDSISGRADQGQLF